MFNFQHAISRASQALAGSCSIKTSIVSILHNGIRPVQKSWRKQSLSYEPRSRRSWGWFPFLLYKWDLQGLHNLQNRQHKGVGFPAARYKQFLTEDPEAEFLEGRREPLIPFSWKVLLVLVHHLFKERGQARFRRCSFFDIMRETYHHFTVWGIVLYCELFFKKLLPTSTAVRLVSYQDHLNALSNVMANYPGHVNQQRFYGPRGTKLVRQAHHLDQY